MDDEGIIQSGVEANQDSNDRHQSKHRHDASSHRHHHHGNKNKESSSQRHASSSSDQKSSKKKGKKSKDHVHKEPVSLSSNAHHFRQQSPKDPVQPEFMPDREPLAHWPISRNRKAKKAITVTMKGCNVVTVDTTHRVLQKIQEINRNLFHIIENRRRILGMVRKVTTAREPPANPIDKP